MLVQSRGPLKLPVLSRPVPSHKRDGTGHYWVYMCEHGANLHKMNRSYGDDNFIVVWSNKMKCNVTDLEYHNNVTVMQQVAMHVIRC